MKPVDKLVDQFRQNGLKITPQRRVILEFLAQNESHPTAEQVYQHSLSVMPEISRATVYNTIRELNDLGELVPVHDMREDGQRYDTNTGMHHHLYCSRCHKLIDVTRDFDGLSLSPEESAGFRVTSRQVTFYGICPECQDPERN